MPHQGNQAVRNLSTGSSVDSLALRVARRFLAESDRFADEGGEEEDSSKGGVPPRWQEWLDAVHEGGKAKVPNPNAETRDRYHEVAFTTALKDKKTFGKAMKEYYEWIGKHPEKKEPSEKPSLKAEEPKAPEAKKDEPEKKPEKETEPKGSKGFKGFDVSDEEIEKVRKKYVPPSAPIKMQNQARITHWDKMSCSSWGLLP